MMLTFLAAGCLLGTASAAEETPVVRIGFPVQPGISYLDENGRYAGYLVDYLDQLEMFTDWEIEFVQVEGDLVTQLSTLMYMLRDGGDRYHGHHESELSWRKCFFTPVTAMARHIPFWRYSRMTFAGWRRIFPTGTIFV